MRVPHQERSHRSRPGTKVWRAGKFSWLVGFHAAVFLVFMAEPAGADNCQTFTDCFLTAGAASDSALGMAFLGMLSMGLNFVPYVGTAKGIIEAFVGHDLLTGQELTTTDRLLGLIPGGRLGRLGQLGRRGDDVFDMARVGPGGRNIGPPPPGSRGPGRAGPGAGRGGAGDRPPPPPPRGPGGGRAPDPSDPWHNRPPRTQNGSDTTRPRHDSSPDRSPNGPGEDLPKQPRANASQQAWDSYRRNADDIQLQNDNGRLLAQRGFDVDRYPGRSYRDANGDLRSADYELNGHHFEHKVLRGDPDSFAQRLSSSAHTYNQSGMQANRFVVDLNRTDITPQQLRSSIDTHHTTHAAQGMQPDIQEVFAIRNGEIIPIYP